MGSLLEGMLSRSVVRSENTQAISGRPALQPDILVTAPGLAPVVVEAEYMPAANVEPEARSRLGLEVAANGRVIEAAIVLRYPEDVGDAHDLRAALSSIRLSYCVFTEGAEDVHRFPESGWLDGSVEDLAGMVRLVSVPQRAVNRAATALQEGIDGAVRLLDELNETRSGITMSIARRLGMTNVPQTRRMACAIIANALVFHERIAGMHEGVKPLALVCGDGVDNPQEEVLAAWRDILDINYWAIFAIARDILEQLPTPSSLRTLRLGVGGRGYRYEDLCLLRGAHPLVPAAAWSIGMLFFQTVPLQGQIGDQLLQLYVLSPERLYLLLRGVPHHVEGQPLPPCLHELLRPCIVGVGVAPCSDGGHSI